MKAGDVFTATICGVNVIGKIQIEDNRVYLCQDDCRGAYCEDRLGYNYSWFMDYVNAGIHRDPEVIDFVIVNETNEKFSIKNIKNSIRKLIRWYESR